MSDVEVAFPVVTTSGFPHGVRCPICNRSILVGQPYTDKIYGMTSDGDAITILTCVYCEGT